MPARTIAVGDIHGCAKALEGLIAAIAPQPEDVMVPLGDYIDRGPDSRDVLDQLIALEQRCRLVPLLGNHELMLLSVLAAPAESHFWLHAGGQETLDSYDGSLDNLPESHLAFLRSCRRYFETPDHIFLHANYVADLPLDEQPDHLLFWEHLLFSIPPPHQSGKVAVVGHTPQPTGEILDLGHLICIDTYCFGSGWLTALDVDSGQYWQVDQLGELNRQ